MPTLTAPSVATVTITTPGQSVSVTCGAGDRMQVDWAGPGGSSGSRLVLNETLDVGPFMDDTVLTFKALAGSPSYNGGNIARFSADSKSLVGPSGVIRLYPQPSIGVYLGDSIVANGSNASNGYRNARSVLQHALRKIGRPIKIVNEVGFSGKRTDEILTNWETAVTPFNPGFVFWESGVNDFNNSDTADTVFTRLCAARDRAVSEGRRFVYIGMPPLQYGGKYNALLSKIRSLALKDPSFEYAGASDALLDYNATPYEIATGKLLAGSLPDGSHPSAKDANIWGAKLARRLTNIGLVRKPIEAIMGTDTGAGDYLTNPVINGLVGSAGINFSAEVTPATSRSKGTSTLNLVDSGLQSMLPGRLYRTVFAPATTPAVTDRMSINNQTDYSSGAEIYAGRTFTGRSYIKATSTGGNIRGISLGAEVYRWDYGVLALADDGKMFDPSDATGNWLLGATDYEGIFETTDFTLPATWTDPTKMHIIVRAIVYADIGATVTLDMGCVEFQQVA